MEFQQPSCIAPCPADGPGLALPPTSSPQSPSPQIPHRPNAQMPSPYLQCPTPNRPCPTATMFNAPPTHCLVPRKSEPQCEGVPIDHNVLSSDARPVAGSLPTPEACRNTCVGGDRAHAWKGPGHTRLLLNQRDSNSPQ